MLKGCPHSLLVHVTEGTVLRVIHREDGTSWESKAPKRLYRCADDRCLAISQARVFT